MDRPSDGGAVATLAPRGRLRVAPVLVQSGVGGVLAVVGAGPAAVGAVLAVVAVPALGTGESGRRHRGRDRRRGQALLILPLPLVPVGQGRPLRAGERCGVGGRERLLCPVEERRAVGRAGLRGAGVGQRPRRGVLLVAPVVRGSPVKADDQMVAGPGAGDIQEPSALMGVHLLVDRLPCLVVLRLHSASQLHYGRITEAESHRRPAGGLIESCRHPRQHHDGELQALGRVHREDAHAVVVGLGQHRLRDPRVVGALQPGPFEVAAQVRAPRVGPGPGLVGHEPQAAPHVAGPPAGHRGLERPPLADQPVDQRRRVGPALRPMQPRQMGDALGHRVIGGARVGLGSDQREPAPAGEAPVGQVVVAAAVQRGPQRGHQRQFVGRVGHRLEGQQDFADFAGVVDQRRRLGPVGDRGRLQGVLEVGEAGAGRDQYGDVAQAGRPDRRFRRGALVDAPPVPQDPGHRQRDRLGLAAAQLLGVGPARDLHRLHAEDGHRRALGHRSPHRVEGLVLRLAAR